jgi:hypothetical protein
VIPQSDHQRQLRGAKSRIVGQRGINRPHIDRAMAGNGRGRERGSAPRNALQYSFSDLSPLEIRCSETARNQYPEPYSLLNTSE